MCWMCQTQGEVSGYRTCNGCDKLFELRDLKEYDLFTRWGEMAEFVKQKRIVVFCKDCKEEMDTCRKYIKYQAEHDPRPMMLPEPRGRDGMQGIIPVGIYGDGQTLGFHCAQRQYGVDMVDEVLMGFIYQGQDGRTIRRLTQDDIDKTTRCDICWLKLEQCTTWGTDR